MQTRESCKIIFLGPDPPKVEPMPNVTIIWMPLIHIRPIDKCSLQVLKLLEKCDIIVFTSPRGPRILAEDAKKSRVYNMLARLMTSRLIAVIGPTTAKSLAESLGVEPSLIPRRYSSRDLAVLLASLSPNCILLARSMQATKELTQLLKDHNICFEEVHLYSEEIDHNNAMKVLNIVDEESIVVLSSPLIASVFCNLLTRVRETMLQKAKIAVIGPATLRTVTSACGPKLRKIIRAEEYNYKGIIDAILRECKRPMPK